MASEPFDLSQPLPPEPLDAMVARNSFPISQLDPEAIRQAAVFFRRNHMIQDVLFANRSHTIPVKL